MRSIRISTPARLHFGLIDMNGERGRVDGGVGLALESPHTVIDAEKSADLTVAYPDEPEIEERVITGLEAVRQKYDLGAARVRIVERPLPHVGLGSATQTLLGAAHALCRLYGVERSSRELAAVVGRGGTSGIGVAAIESGGFIVDGGHQFRRGTGGKQEYTPSGSTVGVSPPPILVRYDFPNWDVLVVVPLGRGESGLREVTLFKVVCPIPLVEVEGMCHILMFQMMPAVLEHDLDVFGVAMEGFQKIGFKVFEFRAQTALLHECLSFLEENGGTATGMSSWGPALFAFGEDLSVLHKKSLAWLKGHGGGDAILTKADNAGMKILDEA